MPGLSLMCKSDYDRGNVLNSIAELKHEPFYEIKQLIDTDHMMAFFSGYEGYPLEVIENDNAIIFIEGLIYNKNESDIKSSLNNISKSYIENNNYQCLIKDFIDTSDGEFNILISSKSHRKLAIFNDRWGRLPSYYYYHDGMFVFSRELKFILHFMPSIEFDRYSIAEFLMFEFVLNGRTLVKRISRIMPACILNMEMVANKPRLDVNRFYDINFGGTREILSEEQCIEKCKSLLLQSTKDRISKLQQKQYNLTADLSGGFDTRAVFGGLCKIGAAVDYYNDRTITDDESEYAGRLAALFNKKVITLTANHEMNISDMRKIIYLTDCGVNGMTALSCYQDQVTRFKQMKPMSIRFMGIGCGHFIKMDTSIAAHLKTITEMMEAGFLVGFGGLEAASSLLKFENKILYNSLTDYFNKYPETDLKDKLKHWHYEYMLSLVSLGEDRIRLHMWIVETLWSKDFYGFSLKIPYSYLGRGYYFKFLKALEPKLLDVPIFSSRIYSQSSVNSLKKRVLNSCKDTLLRMSVSNKLVKTLIKRYRQRIMDKNSSELVKIRQDILENYNQLKVLSALSDKKRINDYVNDAPQVPLYRLLSLILYFQEIERRYEDKIRIS